MGSRAGRLPWSLALALPLLWVSACTLAPPVTAPLPVPTPVLDAGLSGYASTLADADSEKLEQALSAARKQWQTSRTGENRARLALAYGQWGHGGYDPTMAAEHLRKALQHAKGWPAYDRAFARWRLAQLQHAAERQQAQAALAAENQHLQQQVQQAQEKLRAITEIERELGKTQ